MRISFFRTYKPKQFQFMPRYYDEQKESLKERIRQAEIEANGPKKDEPYRPTLVHGSIKGKLNARRKAQKNSAIRVFVIAMLLLALAYYLIYF